jgi:hypothetical protein
MTAELSSRRQTTRLLMTADSGDVSALGRLVPTLHDELRAMAHRGVRGFHGLTNRVLTAKRRTLFLMYGCFALVVGIMPAGFITASRRTAG